MEVSIVQTGLALIAAAVVGALPPLYRRWSHRGLHKLVSISAGIFLGSLFLHLLPELAAGGGHAHDHGHAHVAAEPSLVPWISLLVGFLALFVVERVWLANRGGRPSTDPHGVLLLAAYLGLGVHALTLGLGISAMGDHVDLPFLIGILGHKAAEAFSLASVMSLAGLSRRRTLLPLSLFALVTPAGLFVGHFLVAGAGSGVVASVLAGLACGTFLYVAVCDLLPEVFHDTEQSFSKLGWVLLGIGLTGVTLPQADGLPAFLRTALAESVHVFEEMALYLLLGFLIAGLLRQFLKPDVLSRHLSGDSMGAVAKASVIGAPLPLCSCSVLPVATSLRKDGASKGATSSFLIATPETGADSVTVTWALLDPFLTIARPIGAVVSALFTGSAVNWFVRRGLDDEASSGSEAPDGGEACCAHDEAAHAPQPSPPEQGRRLGASLRFAFVDIVDDLAGLLLVGVLLSGLISAAIPASVFESELLQGTSGLFLALLVGIPIYVCAAASTPIAASLVLKGLSPGAAFVFLLASPATNLASIAALSRTLGRRVLAVHLAALAVVTLGLGALVDVAYSMFQIAPSARLGEEHGFVSDWLSRVSAIALAALLFASFYRSRFGESLRRAFSGDRESLPRGADSASP